MINLISRQAGARVIRGPAKVFRNLVKGLDSLGYPYVVNQRLDSTWRLWIHDDLRALRALGSTGAHSVLGPNLVVLPAELPRSVSFERSSYVVPAPFVRDAWLTLGFNACPLEVWPVGIDAEEFRPSERRRGNEILVYHKLRSEDSLARVCRSLELSRLPYSVIRYGEYSERAYQEALGRARAVVWHGCHESQGIALLEALASDVPVLVCDVQRLSDAVGSRFPAALADLPVTSAPYFDVRCGAKTLDPDAVGEATLSLLERGDLAPRDFVREELGLERQARAFVSLWERWDLGYVDGLRETARPHGSWRPPRGAVVADVVVRLRRAGIRRLLILLRRRIRRIGD